eukprot:g51957.t1
MFFILACATAHAISLVLLASIYNSSIPGRLQELEMVLDKNLASFHRVILLHSGFPDTFKSFSARPRVELHAVPVPNPSENQYSAIFNSTSYLYSTFLRVTANCSVPCKPASACFNYCEMDEIPYSKNPCSFDSFAVFSDDLTKEVCAKANHHQNQFGAENQMAGILKHHANLKLFNLCTRVTTLHHHCVRDDAAYDSLKKTSHICKYERWKKTTSFACGTNVLTKKRRELTADVDLKYDMKLSADGLSASENVYSILTELETKWMRDGAGLTRYSRFRELLQANYRVKELQFRGYKKKDYKFRCSICAKYYVYKIYFQKHEEECRAEAEVDLDLVIGFSKERMWADEDYCYYYY